MKLHRDTLIALTVATLGGAAVPALADAPAPEPTPALAPPAQLSENGPHTPAGRPAEQQAEPPVAHPSPPEPPVTEPPVSGPDPAPPPAADPPQPTPPAPELPGKGEPAVPAGPVTGDKGKTGVPAIPAVPVAGDKGKTPSSAPQPADPLGSQTVREPNQPTTQTPALQPPAEEPVDDSSGSGQGDASQDEQTVRTPAARDAPAAAVSGRPVADAGADPSAAGAAVSDGARRAAERRQRAARGPDNSSRDDSGGSPVSRAVRDVVEVVPDELKAAMALLAVLAVLFGGGYVFAALRARRLARQRGELLQEVGLLQSALLPPVPEKVGAVRASVAYRPSEGPGAGGDFYDAIALPGGRAAFILGDVSGHGREALAHTAFMRYTLRAYLEAGLEPRMALQVAERAVGGQLGGDFATVIVAVHDPSDGSLTYASAGHPAPIVAGGGRHEPVMAAWSPPIGWGLPTGLRQTTVPLPSGAIACLYTDGLAEAGTADGILGRERLVEIVGNAGRDAGAQDVLDAVAAEAESLRDDMAVVMIAPAREVSARASRTELLEIGPSELHEGLAARFLEQCNVPAAAIETARDEARRVVDDHGGALLVVNIGVGGSRVDVLPRNVESLQAASLRRSAAR